MKQIFFIGAFIFSIGATAQIKNLRNYPVLANANILSKEAETVNANQLVKTETVRFSVVVMNTSGNESVKAGTCYLNIDLGEQLKLVEWAGRSRLPLTSYVNWTISKEENGATHLKGKLIADLPADFTETATFELQCAETGNSPVKAYVTMPAEKSGNDVSSMNVLNVTVKKKKSNE